MAEVGLYAKQARVEAARLLMRGHIGHGEAFTTRQLVEIGVKAGQTTTEATSTAGNLIQAMKRSGDVLPDGRMPSGAYIWRARPPAKPPLPELKAESVVGPYDPPGDREGPNNGLTEAFAEELWRLLGGGTRETEMRDTVTVMEAQGWRRLALELQTWMFARGFVGPGGPRRAEGALNYAWVYDCGNWALEDADGGHVALIDEGQDIPLFLAAPRMREAIQSLLLRYDGAGGVKRADIDTLRASLPEIPKPEEPQP